METISFKVADSVKQDVTLVVKRGSQDEADVLVGGDKVTTAQMTASKWKNDPALLRGPSGRKVADALDLDDTVPGFRLSDEQYQRYVAFLNDTSRVSGKAQCLSCGTEFTYDEVLERGGEWYGHTCECGC